MGLTLVFNACLSLPVPPSCGTRSAWTRGPPAPAPASRGPRRTRWRAASAPASRRACKACWEPSNGPGRRRRDGAGPASSRPPPLSGSTPPTPRPIRLTRPPPPPTPCPINVQRGAVSRKEGGTNSGSAKPRPCSVSHPGPSPFSLVWVFWSVGSECTSLGNAFTANTPGSPVNTPGWGIRSVWSLSRVVSGCPLAWKPWL